MLRKYIFYCVCILLSSCINRDNYNLLDEYKLLYIDLSNAKTYGYKSFFDKDLNKSTEKINISHGAFIAADNKTDVAIHGEGFFKIRLENGLAAYTRSGEFRIDADGNLVTPRGYFLYDNICLGEYFLPDTLEFTGDHIIYIGIIGKNNDIIKTKMGKILTYNIPSELLCHYEDAIYTIKDNAEYSEEITFENKIVQGFLEYSNVHLLPAVLRMYYILSVIDEKLIPNIDFKKELLKIQIEKMADNNYFNNHLSDENTYDINANQYWTHPWDHKLYYLESILPFIKYD